MQELIDKHDAYMMLKAKAESYAKAASYHHYDHEEAYTNAARIIDSMPTIKAAWINCESEMPTPREHVLVFCPKSYYRYRVAEWTGGCWFTETGEKIDYVHSWHKLPESTPEMAAEVIDRDECLDTPDWVRNLARKTDAYLFYMSEGYE